ncbi:MAG TPA: hypothetical protein VMW68_02935, partial [Methyloceanibacter sp.]|nr:hypothetical protein [Methyloceanibacter sp.]
MTRRDRRRSRALARGNHDTSKPQAPAQTRLSINFGCVDRKALLLGTALVSTLLLGTIATPTPANAVVTCATDVGSGLPIDHTGETEPIICVNTEARTGTNVPAIELSTTGDDNYISLYNRGPLSVTSTVDVDGIEIETADDRSRVLIENKGDLSVASDTDADGIDVETDGEGSFVKITNSGGIKVTSYGEDANAIEVNTDDDSAFVIVTNSGALNVAADEDADGIDVETDGEGSFV